jgi:hypothetical protein
MRAEIFRRRIRTAEMLAAEPAASGARWNEDVQGVGG